MSTGNTNPWMAFARRASTDSSQAEESQLSVSQVQGSGVQHDSSLQLAFPPVVLKARVIDTRGSGSSSPPGRSLDPTSKTNRAGSGVGGGGSRVSYTVGPTTAPTISRSHGGSRPISPIRQTFTRAGGQNTAPSTVPSPPRMRSSVLVPKGNVPHEDDSAGQLEQYPSGQLSNTNVIENGLSQSRFASHLRGPIPTQPSVDPTAWMEYYAANRYDNTQVSTQVEIPTVVPSSEVNNDTDMIDMDGSWNVTQGQASSSEVYHRQTSADPQYVEDNLRLSGFEPLIPSSVQSQQITSAGFSRQESKPSLHTDPTSATNTQQLAGRTGLAPSQHAQQSAGGVQLLLQNRRAGGLASSAWAPGGALGLLLLHEESES